MDGTLLTIVTFLPLAGALILLALPGGPGVVVRDDHGHAISSGGDALRWWSLIVSTVAFVISLLLPIRYSYGNAGFQFEQNVAWINTPKIHYHLAVDGISVWLVVLTTFLVPLCVLISWRSVQERVKEFFFLLLVLETAMIGVFVALDLFLFYFFWEATLIPMALLIGMYGHERRIYAAVKFFLYTMIASVFMLAAIIWLYARTGSFDFVAIQQAIASGQAAISPTAALWLFLGFFIAFAVKVPLFPLHTWLPDAHVEAPTAGSILLAGVLLKMGTYGLLRFCTGLFPEQARAQAPWIIALAIIGIIYGALVAMVQPSLKKLVAYSSVSHLGFVVLGIFTFTQMGTTGAVYQMLNHGVSTGALFALVGILYERRHTFEISEFGGLATPMPIYATFFLFITLSSVGLPLLNGFIGEFLILSGAFNAKALYGILAATGVIWSACYLLWMYQRVFYGENRNPANAHLPDATPREQFTLWPLALAALVMGVAPTIWFNAINPSVNAAVRLTQPAVQTHNLSKDCRAAELPNCRIESGNSALPQFRNSNGAGQ
jgi:NADH-quinone oxidoreductase subunit M